VAVVSRLTSLLVGFAILDLLVFCDTSFSEEGANVAYKSVYTIGTMHNHPQFYTVCGASIAGWILGNVKGFSSSADWFKRYWPTPHPIIVLVADFLVFAVAGAYIGTGIYDPTNFVAAVAAGLTWPIGFAALTTRDSRQSAPAGPTVHPTDSVNAARPTGV
jgi:hypothetical protein